MEKKKKKRACSHHTGAFVSCAMNPSLGTPECDSFSSVESGAAAKPTQKSKKKGSGVELERQIVVNCYHFWRSKQPERTEEETCAFVAAMLGVSTQAVLETTKVASAVESRRGSAGKMQKKGDPS